MENEIKNNLIPSTKEFLQDKGIQFFNLIKWIQIGFILVTVILFIYWTLFVGPVGYNPQNVSCEVYSSRGFMGEVIQRFIFLSYRLFPIFFLYQVIFSFLKKSWKLFLISSLLLLIQFSLFMFYGFSGTRYGINLEYCQPPVPTPAMPIQ